MSRTDVHRPGWVKEQDPHNRRHFVTHHDHRAGTCDLDAQRNTYGNHATFCQRRYRGGRNIYCGCRMCTGHHDRKAARRRDRHGWRKTLDRE